MPARSSFARLLAATLVSLVALSTPPAVAAGAGDRLDAFPPGWSAFEARGQGAIRLAVSPERRVLLLLSAPLPKAALAAAEKFVLQDVLRSARVVGQLGTAVGAAGRDRGRVVSARYLWPDGRSSAVTGELRVIEGADHAVLAGFFVAETGGEPSAGIGAEWIFALREQAGLTVPARPAPQPPGTAGSAPASAPPSTGPAIATAPPGSPAAATASPPAPSRPGAAPAPAAGAATAVAGPAMPTTVPAAPLGVRRRETIFPATGPRAWQGNAWARGSFESYGRLDAQGLTVVHPDGAAFGGTGAISPVGAVRLGDLDAGDVTTVRFDLDPGASDAFHVGLCPGRFDNCIGEPGVTVVRRPRPDGAAPVWLALTEGRQIAEDAGEPGSPARLELRVSSLGIRVVVDGRDGRMLPLPAGIGSHAALAVVAQALPPAEGAGARLRLTGVSVETVSDEAAPAATALAPHRIFPGPADAWVPFQGSGGDFAAFARLHAAGLDVAVPPKRGFAWTGIRSAAPVAGPSFVDGERSPRRIRLAVDPARTSGFAAAVLFEPAGDARLGSYLLVEAGRRPDGAWRFGLAVCGSAGRRAEVDVPPRWDGRLDLELRPGSVTARIGSEAFGLLTACGSPGWTGHLAVFAAPPVENEAATLALTGIALDRAVPAGVSPDERWGLVDAADFDPAAFAADLAGAIREGRGRGAVEE